MGCRPASRRTLTPAGRGGPASSAWSPASRPPHSSPGAVAGARRAGGGLKRLRILGTGLSSALAVVADHDPNPCGHQDKQREETERIIHDLEQGGSGGNQQRARQRTRRERSPRPRHFPPPLPPPPH